MKTSILAQAAGLAFILLGCAQAPSSSVDQSRIYTSFSANYDDATQTLQASAIFNFGGPTGTYLDLDGQSKILFDQTPLAETTDAFNQALYNLNLTSAGGTTHVFDYTDNAGKLYENSVVIPNIPAVTYSASSVSINSNLTGSWTTPDVMGMDGLTLTLSPRGSTTTGYATRTPSGDVSGARSGVITFSASDLQGAGVGTYWLQLCRSRNGTLSQATAIGGTISSSGCTVTTPVRLTN